MNPAQLLEHFGRISEAPNAVARLRRFILDLAVRGKLVEQDSNEEPAAELLKRVQAEKTRLVQAGEIKAHDFLPPVSQDELLFVIPAGWCATRLEVVAACLDHMRKPINGTEREKRIAGKAKDNLFPYFGATQQQGWIDDYIFDTELILLGEDGVPFFDDLRPKAYMISGKAWVNNHAHVFRGILVSNVFLAHCLNTFDYTGRVAGATRGKLNKSKAVDIPIVLPPLAEQHRIVAKVEELMALCDQLEAAKNEREARRDRLVAASLHRIGTATPATDEAATEIQSATPLRDAARFHLDHLPRLTTRPEHIKQLRQTILNLAVRGRLVPQDSNDEPATELLKRIRAERAIGRTIPTPVKNPGEDLPAGWDAADLSDYALAVCTGPFGSALHQSDYIKGGIPLVNPSHMVNDRIVSDEMVSVPLGIAERLSSYRLEPGDVVMARRGEVGRAALVEPHQQGWLCGTGSFYLRFSQEINRHYFLLLLRSAQFRSYLAGKAVGTTMVNLNHSILNKARLEIPPLAEQHRIVAKVDELMALCDQLEAQLTATQTDSRRQLEAVLHEALAI